MEWNLNLKGLGSNSSSATPLFITPGASVFSSGERK